MATNWRLPLWKLSAVLRTHIIRDRFLLEKQRRRIHIALGFYIEIIMRVLTAEDEIHPPIIRISG